MKNFRLLDLKIIDLGYQQKSIATIHRAILKSSLLSFCLLFSLMTFESQAQQKGVLKQPVDYINPLIGTAPPTDKRFLGNNPVPGEELYYGCVSPAAMAVDPVVKLGPNTGFDGVFHVRGASYRYTDSSIMGFTHLQHEYNQMANILFMPTVGSIQTIPGSRQHPDSGYRSAKDFKREIASAGYYSVFLTRYGINAELTATKDCGFHRYVFPASSRSNILIDLSVSQVTEPVQKAQVEIVDATHVQGWQKCKSFTVYFYAEFSQPFTSSGTWNGPVISAKAISDTGKNIGAYLTFNTTTQRTVLSKVGISFTSIDDAREKLLKEVQGWSFDDVHKQAREGWNTVLKRLTVEGGTEGEKINFYTSVYRVVEYPDFVGWPRAQTITILARGAKWMNEQLKQMKWTSGKNSFWGLGQASGVLGLYSRGYKEFDIAAAYEALKKDATQLKEAIKPYQQYGFIPFAKPAVSDLTSDFGRVPGADCVNRTLGYAFDDYCIAGLAKALGNNYDYEQFSLRAKNYKNLYDSVSGFMRAKYSDSSWVTPFDPGKTYAQFFYREGTAWHYRWLVLHDIPQLVQLTGGKGPFEKMLDKFFTEPYSPVKPLRDVTGIIGQYCHGNETDRYVPYLYNYGGAPWKAQEMVRRIMKLLHKPVPSGLCGMDDNGYLTGWYAQSALGFYPVNPASGYYDIGSPVFTKVTLELELPGGRAGQFIIEANHASDQNIYVQSVSLNGKSLVEPIFHHSQIVPGGKLIFEMGPTPNKKWGSAGIMSNLNKL